MDLANYVLREGTQFSLRKIIRGFAILSRRFVVFVEKIACRI